MVYIKRIGYGLPLIAIILSVAVLLFNLTPCKFVSGQLSCDSLTSEIVPNVLRVDGEVRVESTPTAGTSGEYLISYGSNVVPQWDSVDFYTLVVKQNDETKTNDATPALDGELVFTPVTNEWYYFEGILMFSGVTTTPGLRARITSGISDYNMMRGSNYLITDWEIGGGNYDIALLSNAAVKGIPFKGVVKGTGASMGISWSQQASHASGVTIHAGSYFRYRKIS